MYYPRCKDKGFWWSVDANFQNWALTVSHSPLPTQAANTLGMHNGNQIPVQLPDLHDLKLLSLCWYSFKCIVHSKSAAFENCIYNYLNLLVVFQTDWDSAHWPSWTQWYFCTGCSHSIRHYICFYIIQFTRYTSVYQPIYTCKCWLFSHNIFLSKILNQATERTWSKHINTSSPTFAWFMNWYSFPLHWPSSTSFHQCSLNSILAESIC